MQVIIITRAYIYDNKLVITIRFNLTEKLDNSLKHEIDHRKRNKFLPEHAINYYLNKGWKQYS